MSAFTAGSASSESLRVIEDLLAIWDSQMTSNPFELQAEIEHESVALFVHAFTARVAENARAVVVLYRSALTISALSVVRSMVEDTATIEFVATIPDGWRRLRDESVFQQSQFVESLEKIDGVSPESHQAREQVSWMEANGSDPRRSKIYRRFVERPARNGRPAYSNYITYSMLSDLTHANLRTLSFYTTVEVDDDLDELGEAGFDVRLSKDGQAPRAETWPIVAAACLFDALMYWNALFGNDNDLTQRLQAQAGRITQLKPDEGHGA